MPAYERALPKDAYSVKLKKKWSMAEVPIDIDAMGFTRTGEDGAIYCLPLFGGDEFVGKVLEGHWKKFWSTDMDANQAFTAIIDGSGTLNFMGEADVAGVTGFGKITSSSIVPILDGVEITVSMQVPVDDTGVTADRDILFYFQLNKLAPNSSFVTDNSLKFLISVDENGLWLIISKGINAVFTNLAYGYNYTMDKTRSTGDLEGVIWRITFHDGHYGTGSPSDDKHMHVYLKQSDTISNAESATEYEVTGSPFDISDLFFEVGYPEFLISSQNTTYFDSGNEAKSTYVKVDYPDIETIYEAAPSDKLLNEAEIWDGEPGNGGVKVYDVDHVFANDVYIQNGLTRVWIDELAVNGVYIYRYISGPGWTVTSRLLEVRGAVDLVFLKYPSLQKIVYISPEKVQVRFRYLDSATIDDNTFLEFDLILRRGSCIVEIPLVQMHPPQFVMVVNKQGVSRFGTSLDVTIDGIGDLDLSLTADNTTMSDNFLIGLDDNPAFKFLSTLSCNKEPSNYLESYLGAYNNLNNVEMEDIPSTIVYISTTLFPLNTNLFKESEDGTTDGTLITDALASPLLGANNAVRLDAQNEYSSYVITSGTDLPEGRYLFVARIKDSNQVVDDVAQYVQTAGAEFRNELNVGVYKTVTASWAYYSVVFDITAADVIANTVMGLYILKVTADANDIDIDYHLVVPIGDGENFPQDLSHNTLRPMNQNRRIVKK